MRFNAQLPPSPSPTTGELVLLPTARDQGNRVYQATMVKIPILRKVLCRKQIKMPLPATFVLFTAKKVAVDTMRLWIPKPPTASR